MRRFTLLCLLLAATALSGCDLLGESPEKVAAAREADGRAIGGACRHAGRAIEDCYLLNKKADKASVFAGWRDMNDYMRENKIESVAPQLAAIKGEARPAESRPAAKPAVEPSDDAGADPASDKKPAKPAKSKTHDS
ncbi:MAG: hypothetical protein KF891_16195 [Rhizobacter sp.]|nr:hypothetical protein [Rhizobacter sp.]